MAGMDAGGQDPRRGWDAVQLTEARQVAVLMDRDPADWPEAQDVRTGFDAVRASGAMSFAAEYLAHALPRLEAIGWAAQVVERAARSDPLPPKERRALDAALRWLGEQTDTHRRAARIAAQDLREPGPEQHLCNAVFYSGGSINMPNQAPLIPPENAAARYALAAVRACVYRNADTDAAFALALGLGEKIAMRGLEAGAR